MDCYSSLVDENNLLTKKIEKKERTRTQELWKKIENANKKKKVKTTSNHLKRAWNVRFF